MRVISLFKVALAASLLFGLSGCTFVEPKVRIQYVKRECPRIRTLRPIPKRYQVKDYKLKFKVFDEKNYLVKKPDLKQAARTSRRKTILIKKQKRYINFYEKQNRVLRRACDQK
jgi:hypothetical protein